MAFIPSPITAPIIRQTSFLQPLPHHASHSHTISLPSPRISPVAQSWIHTLIKSCYTPQIPSKKTPTSNASSSFSETPEFRATVKSIHPVSAAKDHWEITVDVSETRLHLNHTVPGQFVRLGPVSQHISCIFTIASPPDPTNPHLAFIVARSADPCRLASMRPGQPIAISRIMGSGLNYHSFYQKKSNLFAFVDTPQGFAAVKSLLEWPTFRALTGTGANRRNYITVYYTIATNRSIPYADRLSSWSVYGTNIVPLSGISILEYLSKKATVGNPKNNLVADNALACVSKNSTFEGLFCSLVLLGFRRTAIQKFTQEDVEAICRDVDDWAVDDGLPREEDISGERTRVSLEEEIWNSWVGMREEMRTEFEEKWKAKRRMDKENERGRAEKEQAWASWAARNKDQWNQVQWDEDVWRKYWGSWDSARDSWTKENTGQKQGKKEKKKTWNQHDSQEYWDWVGNGAGSKKNGTKAKENSEDWYRTQYTSTAGYGNANNRGSSYQKGGYKYTYEEPKDEKKKQNGYHGQSAKTGSGRKWWENKKSGYQGSSSKRRVWDGFASTPSSGDLDFYSILGIDSGANRSEIKKAYRKQAMQHHPDHNPDNLEGAHAKMKQIVVAWSVLKDDEKRMKYDKSGFIHF